MFQCFKGDHFHCVNAALELLSPKLMRKLTLVTQSKMLNCNLPHVLICADDNTNPFFVRQDMNWIMTA